MIGGSSGDSGAPALGAATASGRLDVVSVNFSQKGDSERYRRLGWSGQEDEFVWTVGSSSHLQISIASHAKRYLLRLDVTPCVFEPHVTSQLLGIEIDGHELGWCRIDGRAMVMAPFELAEEPALAGDERVLEVTFRHPCFLRVDQIEPGADDRPLAICFYQLSIEDGDGASSIDATDESSLGVPLPTIQLQPAPHEAPAAEASRRVQKIYNFPARTAGEAGTAGIKLGDGVFVDEDECTWTSDTASHFQLELSLDHAPQSLRLGVTPLVVHELTPHQRVTVIADGLVLGQLQISAETAISIPLHPFIVAEARQRSGSLSVTLLLPDALALPLTINGSKQKRHGLLLDWVGLETVPSFVAPAAKIRIDDDDAQTPIANSSLFVDVPNEGLEDAIKDVLGLTPAELMRGFESLGDNCAFGLAQRKVGVEVLGLLRFANTPLRALLRGLADTFIAATVPERTEMYLHPDEPREYMLRIPDYGIRWHTMVHEPDADASEVAKTQRMKLGFLRRKFQEGFASGRKIYVLVRSDPKKYEVAIPGWDAPDFAPNEDYAFQLHPVWEAPKTYEEAAVPLSLAEALPVLFDINRDHDNTLLYLTPSTPMRPSGSVDLIAPGLLKGYMSSFVTLADRDSPNDADWIRVAANATLLRRRTAEDGSAKRSEK